MPEDEPNTAPDPVIALGDAQETFDLDAYREFTRRSEDAKPVALVTVVGVEGSAPRGMGSVMAVREDGQIVGTIGGGEIEFRAIEYARAALKDGRPRLLQFDFTGSETSNLGMLCCGAAFVFVQPSGGGAELVIFGAGHIGSALAPMAAAAAYLVTLVDDRPGFPDPEAFGRGVRLLSGDYRETIRRLDLSEEASYLVAVTHAHEKDAEVLDACLERPWKYLGMIGSRAKVGHVLERLATTPERTGRLRHVHAPIGLSLGGRSPGEIAVSILAELQTVRYGREEVAPLSVLREEGR